MRLLQRTFITTFACCILVLSFIFLYQLKCMVKYRPHLYENHKLKVNVDYNQVDLKAQQNNCLLPVNEIEPDSNSFFLVETSGMENQPHFSKKVKIVITTGGSVSISERIIDDTCLGRVELSIIELCTLESAALHHPNSSVNLILTSQVFKWTKPMSDLLQSYSNLHLKYLNFESFIKNSPLEPLWWREKIQESKYLNSHLSDILRFLLLQRYGGTYLDLDQIILKPFPKLGNFIGKESFWIAVGVMRFERDHSILQTFLREMLTAFDGQNWGSNGPQLVSKVIMRFCKSESLELANLLPENCQGIKVFSPDYFYPIHWTNWKSYFDTKKTKNVLSMLNLTYSAHIWGAQSSGLKVEDLKVNHAYSRLARSNCPVTYEFINKI